MKLPGLVLIFLTFFVLSVFADDNCLKWFQDSGVRPVSDRCLLDCNTIIKDLSTFGCANRCEEFCKTNKCKIDSFWEKVLKASPSSKDFSSDEYNGVAAALSRLPADWRPQALKSIVKANKPIDLTAILTPASSTEDQIVLFRRSFSLTSYELTRVIAHEVAHLLMVKEWSKILIQYKKEFGWKDDQPRPGDFVEADGKMSAEEDLANNIEYYIFDPSALKVKSPKIQIWIEKHLQYRLELQKGCKYEK